MSDTSLNKIIQYGTAAERVAFVPDPAVGSQILYIWYETDNAPDTYVWDGSAWVQINTAGGSGIDQLTGDVTAGPGSGSQAATIANDAVTFAKMQNIATDKLLGRDTASSGNVEEIGVSSGIEFTGSAGIRTTENVRLRTLVFIFDGGGAVPATGEGLPVRVPFAGTIVKYTIVGDSPTGSAVVDIWRATFADYPLDSLDTICSGAKPTLTSDDKDENTTLAGWSLTVTAGDFFQANLDSVSGHTYVVVTVDVLVS